MRTLKDLSAAGKRIIVRADHNVPMEAGKIADVSRVKASLPTLQRLLEQGASLVLLSHLGRPNGRFEATSSLAPVTPVLAAQLQRPVTFIGGSAERTPASDATLRQVLPLPQGSVALLDNVRFEPGEGSNDAALARRYARLGETFVLDAFASAHRDHASVTGATRFLPSCAGLLMEKEAANLTRLIQRPAKPFWVVLGGSKAADKIGAVESLLPRVTGMLIGGALAFPFIEAQGGQVGNSLVAAETAGLAKSLLGMAHDRGVQLLLPVDVVAAPKPAVGAEARIVPANHIPAGWKGLDIGPQTRQRFVEALQGARTVFWNGPMGAAEIDGFQGGTQAIGRAIAGLPAAFTVLGGGDTVAAAQRLRLGERFGHVSTGGGACLTFLAKGTLPGIEALS